MVIPSCAVITVVMVFEPTANAIGADAVPHITAVPFTFTVAADTEVVGVRVMDVTELATLSV